MTENDLTTITRTVEIEFLVVHTSEEEQTFIIEKVIAYWQMHKGQERWIIHTGDAKMPEHHCATEKEALDYVTEGHLDYAINPNHEVLLSEHPDVAADGVTRL